MQVETQLNVFLENERGAIAKLAGLLGKAEVNILAMLVPDNREQAVVRLVVDDADKAAKVLKEEGLALRTSRVLQVPLSNEPGQLHTMTRQIAQARVDVDYMYGSVDREGDTGFFIFGVSDIKAARKALS